MIEPTDEMFNAFWVGASWPRPGDLDIRRGLAAVLAIVERERLAEPRRLLEYALHLRMYGERAPGGNETWAQFDRDVEAYLRSLAGDSA